MTEPTTARRQPIPPRRPQPQPRFHLYGALAATALAALAVVGALFLRELPPQAFSIVLFAAAPLSALVALPILWSRAHAERDEPLLWITAGLALSVLAMLLQLVSFPTVSPAGGPLGTSGDASAALYLLFHLVLVLGAYAGALGLHPRWRIPAMAVGALVILLVAVDLAPLPALLTEDEVFTPLLIRLEEVLVVLMILAVVLWARSAGAVSTPLRGWVGVALSLSTYDVLLNAVAARRYDPVWWSSLSMRAASFAVLAAGAVGAVLVQMHRFERYSEGELTRREQELQSSVTVTEQLLDNARNLASATTAPDVVAALANGAAVVAELPRVLVFQVDRDTGDLSILGGWGYDAQNWAAVTALDLHGLPANQAVETGQPVYVSTHDELISRFPAMAGAPVHATRTACLAAVPMTVAGHHVGVLAVTGDRPQVWSETAKRLLTGLAAQGGQALLRSLLYEREHSTAAQLQRSLLPRSLPDRGDVSLAALYVPGGDGVQVGGDWYDCIECGDQVALVVGDVVGMGLDAATVMGRLSTAVRILAALDPSPAAVLDGLDRAVAQLGPDAFATVVYLLLDPARQEALLSRAGHMPPVVVRPGQPAELVTDGASLPIGAPAAERPVVRVPIPPGTVVVLYSDGLVEDRVRGVQQGIDLLLSSATRLTSDGCRDPRTLAGAMLEETAPPGRPDDIAVLVAVTTGAE
jgi:hypothetical protein